MGLLLVAALAATTLPLEAGAAECSLRKTKLVAKAVADVTRCHATAARRGTAVDGRCIDRVVNRLTARWDAAEAVYTCASKGDRELMVDRISAFVADVEAAVGSPGGPSACMASAQKSAGRSARCLLKCQARALRRGEDLSGGCIARCEQRDGCPDCAGEQACAAVAQVVSTFAQGIATALPGDLPAFPECTHDRCEPGDALELCDDACVRAICSADPYCCTVAWDAVCIAHVATTCGLTCATCGDGAVAEPEVCDPGNPPVVDADGCPGNEVCRSDCSGCESYCGDGHLSGGETCDPPGGKLGCQAGALCSFDCTACEVRCGDGIVDPASEQCDPGEVPNGCPEGQSCRPDCGGCEVQCGDGIVGAGEACEPPGGSGDGVCGAGESCRQDCRACEVRCGDGVLDAGEICDPPLATSGCGEGNVCLPGCSSCGHPCETRVTRSLPPQGGTIEGDLSGLSAVVDHLCGVGLGGVQELIEWTASEAGPVSVRAHGANLSVFRHRCDGSEIADCSSYGEFNFHASSGTTFYFVVEKDPLDVDFDSHYTLTVVPGCGDGLLVPPEGCDGAAPPGCPDGFTCDALCGCTAQCNDGVLLGAEVCDMGVGCPYGSSCAECSECITCPPAVEMAAAGGTLLLPEPEESSVVGGSCFGSTRNVSLVRWIPAQTGVVRLSSPGPIAIREDSCGGPELVCDGFFGRAVSTAVEAGREYFILAGRPTGQEGDLPVLVAPGCGDGVIGPEEECDRHGSQSFGCATGYCNDACVCEPACGNGAVEPGEVCERRYSDGSLSCGASEYCAGCGACVACPSAAGIPPEGGTVEGFSNWVGPGGFGPSAVFSWTPRESGTVTMRRTDYGDIVVREGPCDGPLVKLGYYECEVPVESGVQYSIVTTAGEPGVRVELEVDPACGNETLDVGERCDGLQGCGRREVCTQACSACESCLLDGPSIPAQGGIVDTADGEVFEWVPDEPGRATVAALSALGYIAVYAEACADRYVASGRRVSIDVEAGTLYYIRVYESDQVEVRLHCGDGQLDGGEQCDPPGSSDGCDPGYECDVCSCALACGDGVWTDGEVCDGALGCGAMEECTPDCLACQPVFCPPRQTIRAAGGGGVRGSSYLPSVGSCGEMTYRADFEWTPAEGTSATFESPGRLLYVRHGNCSGSEVACGLGSVTTAVEPGTTYIVMVEGFRQDSSPLTVFPGCGDGQILGVEQCDPSVAGGGCDPGSDCVGCQCQPICGDHAKTGDEACDAGTCGPTETCNLDCTACNPCPSATTVPIEGGSIFGAGRRTNILEGSCNESSTFNTEALFRWTPARSGRARLAAEGLLYVRTDTCGGVEVACASSDFYFGSGVKLDVVAGQTYFIGVDSRSRAGLIRLEVVPPPIPSTSRAFLGDDAPTLIE